MAELAAQLAARLVVGYIVEDIEVIDCTRVLQAVLIELAVWFKGLLAFIWLAYALI